MRYLSLMLCLILFSLTASCGTGYDSIPQECKIPFEDYGKARNQVDQAIIRQLKLKEDAAQLFNDGEPIPVGHRFRVHLTKNSEGIRADGWFGKDHRSNIFQDRFYFHIQYDEQGKNPRIIECGNRNISLEN